MSNSSNRRTGSSKKGVVTDMIDELNRRKRRYGFKRVIACFIIAAVTLVVFLLFLSPDADDGDMAMLVFSGIAFVFSAISGIIILIMSRSDATKQIVRFCNQSSSSAATMARLEQTWQHGTEFKYGKMDGDYIIAQVKLKARVFSLHDAVWVYGIRQSINFIPVTSTLYVYYKDKKRQTLSFSGFRSKHLDTILTCVYSQCPHIYVGNDFTIGKLVKAKNWQELSRYAQMQRTA